MQQQTWKYIDEEIESVGGQGITRALRAGRKGSCTVFQDPIQ